MGIPLNKSMWGIACIVRIAQASMAGNGFVFVYGFKGVYGQLPTHLDLCKLRRTDAILFCMGNGKLIKKGTWPVIGQVPAFTKEDWFVPPTTDVLMEGELRSKRMSEQAITLIEDVQLCDNVVMNDGLVSESDYKLLPIGYGAGDAEFIAFALRRALLDKSKFYTCSANTRAWAVWKLCIDRAKRRGDYPRARPHWKV